MKTKRPVLEYCLSRTPGGKRLKWAFRFRTPEGEVLIESAKMFTCKAHAERAFVSLIKSVATNQYKVEHLDECDDQAGFLLSLDRRCAFGRPGRLASNRRFLRI